MTAETPTPEDRDERPPTDEPALDRNEERDEERRTEGQEPHPEDEAPGED